MDQLQMLERDHEVDLSDRARRPSAEPASSAIAAALPVVPIVAAPAKPGFAGFSFGQMIIGTFVLGAAVWGMWATNKILALEDRRVVSVRLAAIVNDFVTAEARSGTPPEQLAGRTRAFMTALDAVLKARAARGEVVLVGEAVVASSVSDVTSDVVADLAKVVKLATPVAMPPALAPPASGDTSSDRMSAPGPAPAPAPQGSGANPVELVPGQ